MAKCYPGHHDHPALQAVGQHGLGHGHISLAKAMLKKYLIALTGVAQLVGCCPAKQKVASSIAGEGTRGNHSMFPSHMDVSLPLSFPPFPSL